MTTGSMFDGIESFDEAMKMFRRQVIASDHVCGQPGGCKAVTISVPFCRMLATSLMSLRAGKATEEEFERLKARSLEEWLQEALSILGTDDSIVPGS